jgi:hypothetical protein
MGRTGTGSDGDAAAVAAQVAAHQAAVATAVHAATSAPTAMADKDGGDSGMGKGKGFPAAQGKWEFDARLFVIRGSSATLRKGSVKI